MKLTRRQLTRLIKENLLVEKSVLETESRGFKQITLQTNGIFGTTSNGYDFAIDNIKAKYSSNLVGLKNTDDYRNINMTHLKPSKKSTSDKPILFISFTLPGKVYGENRFSLNISLNKVQEGENKYNQVLQTPGDMGTDKVFVSYKATKQDVQLSSKTKDDIEKNVKTFTPKIPWAQSKRYENDVRFFQLFILYCIAGENLIGINILDNKEFVYKMLGSVNTSKYPDGFDGQWGPKTTKTWNTLIDRFPDGLSDKMYRVLTGQTTDYSKNIDVKAQLKNYKKVTAKIPVDEFISLIDSAVGLAKITGTNRTLERMVEEAIEIGIAIPESYTRFV